MKLSLIRGGVSQRTDAPEQRPLLRLLEPEGIIRTPRAALLSSNLELAIDLMRESPKNVRRVGRLLFDNDPLVRSRAAWALVYSLSRGIDVLPAFPSFSRALLCATPEIQEHAANVLYMGIAKTDKPEHPFILGSIPAVIAAATDKTNPARAYAFRTITELMEKAVDNKELLDRVAGVYPLLKDAITEDDRVIREEVIQSIACLALAGVDTHAAIPSLENLLSCCVYVPCALTHSYINEERWEDIRTLLHGEYVLPTVLALRTAVEHGKDLSPLEDDLQRCIDDHSRYSFMNISEMILEGATFTIALILGRRAQWNKLRTLLDRDEKEITAAVDEALGLLAKEGVAIPFPLLEQVEFLFGLRSELAYHSSL